MYEDSQKSTPRQVKETRGKGKWVTEVGWIVSRQGLKPQLLAVSSTLTLVGARLHAETGDNMVVLLCMCT